LSSVCNCVLSLWRRNTQVCILITNIPWPSSALLHITCCWFHRITCNTPFYKTYWKLFILKLFPTRFNQYGHHEVFKFKIQETAVLLISWLWLLAYGPFYAHVPTTRQVVLPVVLRCVVLRTKHSSFLNCNFKHLMMTHNYCFFFLLFSILRYSRNYKTRRFGNWACFRPQVRRKTPTQLGPVERANLNIWTQLSRCSRPRLRMQKISSRVLYFLEYRTMEKIQKPSNSEFYTPSYEPFRIYLMMTILVDTSSKKF
jgi:hypothetical protein